MTLIERAGNLDKRLGKVVESRDGVKEGQNLQLINSNLMKLATPIAQGIANFELLEKKGVNLSSIDTKFAIIEAQNILNFFLADSNTTTLKQHNRLEKLTDVLGSVSKKIQESQLNDWCEFYDSKFYAGETPTQKESMLPNTPANSSALQKYKALYPGVTKFRQNIPRNDEEFENLVNISKQLDEINFQVGEDVPQSVIKFFNAIKITGASLELLNAEVLDWLKENNLLNNYTVRVKS
jgi:hypothetical protein